VGLRSEFRDSCFIWRSSNIVSPIFGRDLDKIEQKIIFGVNADYCLTNSPEVVLNIIGDLVPPWRAFLLAGPGYI
jgi:hypothetical protein